MTCIKMGSDESRFNVSLIARDKVTRPCPQTTTFEEKGEPKRYRTEVLPLTSLTPYRYAKPAHITGRYWGCFYHRISTRTFRRALTASVDSCAEIKSAPSVASLNLTEFGGRCRKAMLGVWWPESNARSVVATHTPSTAFRYFPPNSARF